MGATGIEWTKGPNGEQGYTFNPWIGCTKLSPACDNCYAETAAIKLDTGWGPHADRRMVSETSWNAVRAIDRKARKLRCRFRIFTGSMCDILDNHHSIPDAVRWRLWALMEETPNIDWLPLTKRPQNARRFLPRPWFNGAWPKNVWFGFTAEDQPRWDQRWPHVADMPAPVIFASMEPYLGRILLPYDAAKRGLNWVIAGGESGRLSEIRNTADDLFEDMMWQCRDQGIAFFQKQLAQLQHRAAYKRFDTFPEKIRVREQPQPRRIAA